MRITIISFDNWGLNNKIADFLISDGHIVNHIDFSKFHYKYASFLKRIENALLKTFTNKNLKHMYYGQEIEKQLEKLVEKQDLILTIKADFIDNSTLVNIKKYTHKSVAFFNDSVARYPNIKNKLHCFDKVYSFEKPDCEKYSLNFKSNFIYSTIQNNSNTTTNKFQLFNISSRDKRYNLILEIAKKLKSNAINYKIIISDVKNRVNENEFLEVIRKPISLEKIDEYIEESGALLDIQRKKQTGLTFRVFESIAKQKKLITTNPDIKNYDFYNENNFLIINPNKIEFSSTFFDKPYLPIDEKIVKKYQLKQWFDEFLN